MGHKFFVFVDNNSLHCGIVSNQYDLVDCIMSSVPIGIDFYVFDSELDQFPTKEDSTYFYDSWELLTNNVPDGTGLCNGGHAEWLEYKKQNNFNNEIIYNEINKQKHRRIIINIKKAIDIWKNILREQRKSFLERLDVQYIRALERGETELIQKIVKKKEFLRDITDDPRFEIVSNTDELKEIVIPPNFIEE